MTEKKIKSTQLRLPSTSTFPKLPFFLVLPISMTIHWHGVFFDAEEDGSSGETDLGCEDEDQLDEGVGNQGFNRKRARRYRFRLGAGSKSACMWFVERTKGRRDQRKGACQRFECWLGWTDSRHGGWRKSGVCSNGGWNGGKDNFIAIKLQINFLCHQKSKEYIKYEVISFDTIQRHTHDATLLRKIHELYGSLWQIVSITKDTSSCP